MKLRAALLGAAAALTVTLLVVTALEEGLADASQDVGRLAVELSRRYGPAVSLASLYAEESGVPLPVSGDVLVLYLGHRFGGSWAGLIAIWLGLVATVTAGSTNLYLLARRWGRPLVDGPLGAVLHLTPVRLARAERWFARWGALTIIFGRHIIGFRVPVTVAAGVFGVPYRVFAPSVAVSTALWGLVWLGLGVAFGRPLAVLLEAHRWSYALVPAVGLALLLAAVARGWRHRRHHRPADPRAEGGSPAAVSTPEGTS